MLFRSQMLLRDRLLDFVNPSRRPRFAAIQELTFEVRPGESLGLLGPNGAGKSTILNLATGLLEPDAGFVEAHGRVTPLLDLLGGLQSDLTGVENLRLNASMLGFTRKDFEERLEQIVEFSGVRDFLHEPLRTYSQGMQLRLAFSVAVHASPNILLLDEVIGVGDQAFYEKALAKIRQLRASGTTLLFASHSAELLRMLCDNALWLERGRIVKQGPVAEVIDAYQSAPRQG